MEELPQGSLHPSIKRPETDIILTYCNCLCYCYSDPLHLVGCKYHTKSVLFSIGSVCFWASWIRILPSSSTKSKKNLDSYCFVTSFLLLSLKNYVNVPSKSNKQ
jgi:hypothetical protein